MKCIHCDDWEPNMGKISSYETIAYIHGMPINAKQFNFCPYCGWILVDDNFK